MMEMSIIVRDSGYMTGYTVCGGILNMGHILKLSAASSTA